MLRIFVSIITLSVLVACGPQYRDQSTYVPPESIEGRSCVAQCETTRELCRLRADQDNDICRAENRDVEREYRRCIERRNGAKQRQVQNGVKIKLPTCFRGTRRFCRPDYKSCTAEYNACYQRCGGQVTTRRVCVANCN